MENWLIYFAKVNGLLVLFYLMYILFLRKETFFTSNRWYLILGLISSFVLPLITFTKTVWVESKPAVFEEMTNYQPVLIENITEVEEAFNWNEILIAFYSLVAIIVLLKIGFEIASFFRNIKNQERKKEEHFTLINSSKTDNPYSFFSYIVVNQQQFSEEELLHILIHESIHVKQKHSFDVIFSRIICAILWLNPVVWLYRKAIIQNLEFIADHQTYLTINNKYAYQKTLLKVVISNNQSAITNQFFQSLIKKRIVMLNTNQSHKKKSWKYAVILPFLIAFTLLFQIETVAQEKVKKTDEVTTYAVSSSYSSIVTKNTTDQEIKELEKSFSDEKQKLKISNIKRNSNGEIIAIKLEFDFGKSYNRVMERKSDKGINNIKIYINSDEDDDLAYGFEDVDDVTIEVDEIDSLVKDITKSKTWSLNSMKKNGKEVVLIVNGKVKAPKEKVEISFNEELDEMKEISSAEFEKKYNQKASKNKLYYEVETVKVKTVSGSWNDVVTKNKVAVDKIEGLEKISESYESGNKLYIINGKEYLQSEISKMKELLQSNPSKQTSISFDLDGSIISLDKEEGFKRYGEKGKDGVLIFEGNTTFISVDENEPKQKRKTISGGSWDNVEKELEKETKKELELKAQENSKLSKAEIEERMKQRNKRIEERNKLLEERKKKMEERKKELQKNQ